MHEKTAAGIITYKSGRTETVRGKVRKDGQPFEVFQKKMNIFRAFPTVTKVEVVIK